MKLPSKKVLSFMIIVAALVVSVIIIFGREKSGAAINFANNLMVGDKVSMPENTDWERELGKLESITKIAATEATSTETTTDVVSRTLMSNYLALKQSGLLNDESVQPIIDKTMEFIKKDEAILVTESQLNVVNDNGRISMAQYGDDLGNIFKKRKGEGLGNELEALSALISSKNTSKAEELENIALNYEGIGNELVKMSVPKTFIKVHLDIVNNIRNISSALKKMGTILNDPIGGLVAIQQYQNSAVTFVQAVRAVNDFITQNNIVYKQGSGGYYLFYGI